MFKLANQPQGIGRNLDNGFRLLISGIGPAALLLLIMIIAGVILVTIFGAQMFTAMSQLESGQMPAGGMGSFVLFIILLYIIMITIQNAMIAEYGSIAYERKMRLGEAIVTGLKKLIPVIIYAILYGLILLVASLPLIILMAVLQPQGALAAVIGVIGIIPPMIVALTLIMGTYLIIIDDVGIFEAISRSHKMVWGNWWKTLIYLSIIMIIMMAISFAIMFVFGLIIALIAGATEGNMTMMVTLQVTNQLVSFVFMPVMIALIIPYYHDLKLRKEGGDLAVKISAA